MARDERRYHHGDLKSALLARTLERIHSRGADAVSLREVARIAGVSATAAYRHFADKRALLAAAAVEVDEKLAREIASSKDLRTAVRALLSQARDRPAEMTLWLEARPPGAARARHALLSRLSPTLANANRALVWSAVIGALHEGVRGHDEAEAALAALGEWLD